MNDYEKLILIYRKMKHLQLYENYQDIHDICKEYGIENYSINNDGSIDVDGYVYLPYQKLTKLPLKFNRVSGYFDCSSNLLETLEGAPKWVGNLFDCNNNNLKTLEGAPKYVGNGFSCSSNKLLKNLIGSPEKLDGHFFCSDIGLETLEGVTKSINGTLYCENNKLKSFESFPEYVQKIIIEDNPVEEIYRIFGTNKRANDIISVINELDVIQGDKIIMDRLEEAFYILDIEPFITDFRNYDYVH